MGPHTFGRSGLRSSPTAVAPLESPARHAFDVAEARSRMNALFTATSGASSARPPVARTPDRPGPTGGAFGSTAPPPAPTAPTARIPPAPSGDPGSAFRRDHVPDGTFHPTRAVEVQRRPMWDSFAVAATRDFLRREQTYQLGVVAQGLPRIPLHELIDRALLPGISAFVLDRIRVVLPDSATLSSATHVLEWDRCVRHAINNYLSDPKLKLSVSLDDLLQHLKSEVWWDSSMPTLVEARTSFHAQFLNCLHVHSMRDDLFRTPKTEKRVTALLVGMLRPLSWQRHVDGQLQRLDTLRVQDLFDFLADEDVSYLAHCSANSTPASQSGEARYHEVRGASPKPMAAGWGGAGSSDPTPRPPPSACPNCGDNHWLRDCTRPRGAAPADARPHRPPSAAAAPRTGGPPSACYTCGGMHWARDCPEPRTGRGAGASGPLRPQRDFRARRCHSAAPSDGVIAYGDGCMLPFCLDTGCNASYISTSHAMLLQAAAPDTSHFVALDCPVTIALPGSEQLTVTHKLVCDTPLTLRARCGLEYPVHVDLFVADGMRAAEVLLGREVFLALPDDVRTAIIVMGDTPVSTPTTPTTRALPTPVPPVVDVEPDSSVHCPVLEQHSVPTTTTAMEAILTAAAATGLSPATVQRLRDALMSADLLDVFSGPIPPANAAYPPAVITAPAADPSPPLHLCAQCTTPCAPPHTVEVTPVVVPPTVPAGPNPSAPVMPGHASAVTEAAAASVDPVADPLSSPPSAVVPDIHSAPTGAELLAEQAMAAACGPPPLGASPPEDDWPPWLPPRATAATTCSPSVTLGGLCPVAALIPPAPTSPAASTPPPNRPADADLTVTPQLLAFVAHSGRGYAIDSIIDHKLHPAQLLVRWEGFVDPTWEPLHTVFSDTPVSVRRYARTVVDLAQRAALLALLRDLAA